MTCSPSRARRQPNRPRTPQNPRLTECSVGVVRDRRPGRSPASSRLPDIRAHLRRGPAPMAWFWAGGDEFVESWLVVCETAADAPNLTTHRALPDPLCAIRACALSAGPGTPARWPAHRSGTAARRGGIPGSGWISARIGMTMLPGRSCRPPRTGLGRIPLRRPRHTVRHPPHTRRPAQHTRPPARHVCSGVDLCSIRDNDPPRSRLSSSPNAACQGFLRRVGQRFIESTGWSSLSSGSLGLLIQAVVGSAGGSGCLRTNRSGLRV